MTALFLYATAALLGAGIPISAIYWWVHSWKLGVYHEGYWGQWERWVIISLVIIASLWTLYLIVWIITKMRERKLYRDTQTPTTDTDVPPYYGPIYIDSEGNATFNPPPNASGATYTGSETKAPHVGGWQFINSQKLKELVEKGKLKPIEALKYQQAIDERGENIVAQHEFGKLLEAIDLGVKSERPEHDESQDSIFKRFGIDPNKFKL